MHRIVVTAVATLLLGAPIVLSEDAPSTQPIDTEAAAYEESIQRRVGETIDQLKLEDPAKAEEIRQKFLQNYRDLRAWHVAHYDEYKKVKAEFEKLDKDLRGITRTFIKDIEKSLTPEQVAMIQERMVGGRYQHNIGGLNAEYPDLPEGVRSYAMDMWAEARDIAMSLPEGRDKTAVFERYKAKVNNYISSKGIKGKSWYEKEAKKKAAEEAAQKPSETPKP